MSNLLKKGSTITKSERVIDYNGKIKEKLQAVIDAESAAGDQSSDGFVNGLTADVVERLTQMMMQMKKHRQHRKNLRII